MSYEKVETYHRLKEQLEQMLKFKASVVHMVVGALGAVAPKLGVAQTDPRNI